MEINNLFNKIIFLFVIIIIINIYFLKDKIENYNCDDLVIQDTVNNPAQILKIENTGEISTTSYVPIGTIIAYAGSLLRIPSGWAICDGSNGTVDLRNKFIVGYDNYDDTSTFDSVGKTGGSEKATLTTENLPKHSHTINYGKILAGTNPKKDFYCPANKGNKDVTSTYFRTGPMTYNTDKFSAEHNNMPPYYKLYYIMKIYESKIDTITL